MRARVAAVVPGPCCHCDWMWRFFCDLHSRCVVRARWGRRCYCGSQSMRPVRVMSARHVTSRHVTSRHVITSCHVMSRHVVSCHVMSRLESCRVMSCRVVSRRVASRRVVLRTNTTQIRATHPHAAHAHTTLRSYFPALLGLIWPLNELCKAISGRGVRRSWPHHSPHRSDSLPAP